MDPTISWVAKARRRLGPDLRYAERVKFLKALVLILSAVIVAFALYIHTSYEGGVPAFVDDLVSSEGPDVNKIEQEFELDIDS